MQEAEAGREQPGPPDMDRETYERVQELFGLVRAGDTERLAGLLEMGLVPNLRDGQGNSLLMLAAYNGRYDAARLLLRWGGDPHLANDRGQIPLAGAAFKGDAEMARLLLEHGAEVDAAGPDGKTPLMFAAMFDRVDILKLLLARGADPARRDADGNSPLSLARGMGAESAAARLQASGGAG